MHPTITDP